MKKERDSKEGKENRLSKNERIEQHLREGYDFRFNTVKSRTEYWEINTAGCYQPVTRYVLNSFRRELDVRAGITTSADNIRAILESNFSRKVHPSENTFQPCHLLTRNLLSLKVNFTHRNTNNVLKPNIPLLK